MKRVNWASPARLDLAAIVDPFTTDRPDFIDSAMVQIARIEDLLIDNPGIGARMENSELRKVRVGKTPIILIYRIERAGVTILRVLHAASDWRK